VVVSEGGVQVCQRGGRYFSGAKVNLAFWDYKPWEEKEGTRRAVSLKGGVVNLRNNRRPGASVWDPLGTATWRREEK